jgi:Plasmid pRiA4b ORF-3-like protein
VVVQGIRPLIWCRRRVRSDMSLATPHITLQIVFAWSDVHLYGFRIHGKEYGSARLGGPSFDVDARHVQLVALRLHRGERFSYVYNLIVHWECELRLEAMLPWDPQRHYPACLRGKRAAPPEDCGGPWAYLHLVDQHHVPLEAMAIVATAIEHMLEADAQTPLRQAIGDLETFREAVDQLDAYLQLQPEHFTHRDVNTQLCAAEWSRLPIPNGPLTVGIDGDYVRAQRKQCWFEVITGKSLLAFTRDGESEAPASSKCFAFVQIFDQKPKRHLFEVLNSQGHQLNQQITFLSDGGNTVRDLQLYLNPHAEYLLAWFHLSMQLTVLQQTAKGLPDKTHDGEEDYPLRDPVVQELDRLKGFLWHGNVYKALQVVQSVEIDLDAAVAISGHGTARKLLQAVEEFHTCIEHNGGFMPNYGERYRQGERSSTGFVESPGESSDQQTLLQKAADGLDAMRPHLLLQIRTRVLNGDWEATFREWYPGFRAALPQVAA